MSRSRTIAEFLLPGACERLLEASDRGQWSAPPERSEFERLACIMEDAGVMGSHGAINDVTCDLMGPASGRYVLIQAVSRAEADDDVKVKAATLRLQVNLIGRLPALIADVQLVGRGLAPAAWLVEAHRDFFSRTAYEAGVVQVQRRGGLRLRVESRATPLAGFGNSVASLLAGAAAGQNSRLNIGWGEIIDASVGKPRLALADYSAGFPGAKILLPKGLVSLFALYGALTAALNAPASSLVYPIASSLAELDPEHDAFAGYRFPELAPGRRT